MKVNQPVNFLISYFDWFEHMNKHLDQDAFLTLAKSSSGIYKEKGSKFLYFAFPVENEEQIKAKLLILRKDHFDATHHCYAWILGSKGLHFRCNDDGEPNHSAGDPILGQIRSYRLTNVLIVVVRYFGGTKLGVSGLIQAYKTSAELAIGENEILEKKVMQSIKIEFTYARMNEVMKIVKTENLQVTHQELGLDCKFTLEMRESIFNRIKTKFLELDTLKITSD
jgi:uncharacterized YigZ family protein